MTKATENAVRENVQCFKADKKELKFDILINMRLGAPITSLNSCIEKGYSVIHLRTWHGNKVVRQELI